MTVCLGYADGKSVHIITDSGSFTSCDRSVYKNEKVFTLNGGFLVAVAGSWRLNQLIRYEFTAPARPNNLSDMEYLVTYFIDSLRNLLKDKGFSVISENQESTDDGIILLGYNGNLYTIDNDYHVAHNIDNTDSIGAGAHYCIAAWDALSHIKDVKKRMLKAIDIAEKRCTMVSKPYVYKVLKSV